MAILLSLWVIFFDFGTIFAILLRFLANIFGLIVIFRGFWNNNGHFIKIYWDFW